MARTALIMAAALSATAMASPALAAGDPAVGARLFLQCRACHTVGATERHGVGPNLYNVVGAKAGARVGYAYSPALTKTSLVWTPANLDAFLKKPSAIAPGTKMAFAGVPSPKAREDLIAYLATLKGAKR
jgi:cytochrome c